MSNPRLVPLFRDSQTPQEHFEGSFHLQFLPDVGRNLRTSICDTLSRLLPSVTDLQKVGKRTVACPEADPFTSMAEALLPEVYLEDPDAIAEASRPEVLIAELHRLPGVLDNLVEVNFLDIETRELIAAELATVGAELFAA
jgi:hypothetical protein